MRRVEKQKAFWQEPRNITTLALAAFIIGGVAFGGFAYWAKQDRDERLKVHQQWLDADSQERSAQQEVDRSVGLPDKPWTADDKRRLEEAKKEREKIEKRSMERWGKHPRDL